MIYARFYYDGDRYFRSMEEFRAYESLLAGDVAKNGEALDTVEEWWDNGIEWFSDEPWAEYRERLRKGMSREEYLAWQKAEIEKIEAKAEAYRRKVQQGRSQYQRFRAEI